MKSKIFGLILGASFASANAFAAMDLAAFKEKGEKSDKNDRCTHKGTEKSFCHEELKFALDKDLITKAAHDWGKENDYFPVINRHNEVGAVCKCGCFEENTAILMKDADSGEYSYKKIKDLTKESRVAALQSDANLSSLKTYSAAVNAITKGPEEAPLYAFSFGESGTLKLTQHHGVVLSDGKVIAAKDVKVGDEFISITTGKPVKINKIMREVVSSDVLNFRTEGSDNINHIVVANDVLVGDLRWQNGLASELGSVQIRK